ncbi:MAG: hypothetical protein AB8B80_10025 [Marinicellaceae bacterium]
MKHKTQKILTIFALLSTFTTTLINAQPKYANEKTKEVVEKMVKAHGGLEKWRSIPAISFNNIMHNNYHATNELAWWASKEIIDQKTRQVYQDWFLDSSQIGYDGNNVWSNNWKKANPPKAMVYFFYYFINLPWITQDDGVSLSEVKSFEWPGHGGKVYHEVKLTFDKKPVVGKSALDYFILYIDQNTNILAGYQYALGNKELLKSLGQPPERKLFGPLWRVIVKNQTIDGLIFPAAFRTMPEADERIDGKHIITNIDVKTEFDFGLVKPPKNAIIYEKKD